MKWKVLTAACLILSSSLALAAGDGHHPLKIFNHTPYKLTFSINGQCSENIGSVNPNSKKRLSVKTLNSLCDSCKAMVHNSDNCSGKIMGYFTLVPTKDVSDYGVSYQSNLMIVAGSGEVEIDLFR